MNPRMSIIREYFSLLRSFGDEPFSYYENNVAGTEITTISYLGTKSNVTIPSKIDNKTVTEVGVFTFSGMTNIRNVTIPDTVTSIG